MKATGRRSLDCAESCVPQAFRVAVSGSPGPVHLQFRGNEGQIDQDEAEFDTDVPSSPSRISPHRPIPDREDAGRLLELLQEPYGT